jgi:hypothetical protein
MIFRLDMMSELLGVCPSFSPRWQAFRDEWKDKGDYLPLYWALADFARHLIEMLERGDTRDFPLIFATVERLVVEGDDYVREAATVGLLEDLQNLNLHAATKPDQFREYLKPESERQWGELYRDWERVARWIVGATSTSEPRRDVRNPKDGVLRKVLRNSGSGTARQTAWRWAEVFQN